MTWIMWSFFFVPICAQNSLQEFLSGLFYYQKNWKTLKIKHDLDDLEKAIHKQAIRYILNRLISSRYIKVYFNYDKCQFLENVMACMRLSEFIQIYHRKSTKSVYTCSCKYKWTNKKEKKFRKRLFALLCPLM